MGPSQYRPLHPLPLVCRKTLASEAFPKLQRTNLIIEVRNEEIKENDQAK